jgi:hypothetical protein
MDDSEIVRDCTTADAQSESIRPATDVFFDLNEGAYLAFCTNGQRDVPSRVYSPQYRRPRTTAGGHLQPADDYVRLPVLGEGPPQRPPPVAGSPYFLIRERAYGSPAGG